ncbi:MAG: cytochrome c [Flavobacterium sp.]|jgi:cytochrome c
MKNAPYTFFLILVFAITSCKNSNEKDSTNSNEVATLPTSENGKVVFEANNCAACHQVNEKVIGPSLETIASVYKEKNANLKAFLLEEAEPIIDPEQYESMRINLQLTKSMTTTDLESLVLYLKSYEK